jgi:hypothetical protein
VDLTRLTRGFTNSSPVYTAANPTGGTVSLLGGTTARFVANVSTDSLGGFVFSVLDAQGHSMTNVVGVHIIASGTAAQAPVLGIRNQDGLLLLEFTGESGRAHQIQTSTSLSSAWLDWTNLTGSGATLLLPLNDLTNQSPRFFRAFTQ